MEHRSDRSVRWAKALGVLTAVALLGAACKSGGQASPPSGANSTPGSSSSAPVKEGGIFRVGTIDYIDSLNPYNYIESQATNAMIMVYPQLVQYKYSKADGFQIEGDWAKSWDVSPDGKVYTFHLIAGATWSDGKPITADDAAWTIATTLKFQNGPTAEMAPALGHVKSAVASDPNTLVITYDAPVGNALAQLEQLFILPEHAWAPLAAGNGKGLKTFHPEQHLPMVAGGAYNIKTYVKKGTTVFIPLPNFYGPKSHAQAVTLTYYTNADSMLADLEHGQLDFVDQVPFDAVKAVEKDTSLIIDKIAGSETTNVTWNSNPRKLQNRELLDPRVKKALSMCIDRQRIIDVVFSGYADTVESIVGHISPMENKNLGPLQYDCAAGNAMLDQLGYTKGSDDIRMVPATTGQYAQPAHPMKYEILTPTSTDFNVDREFEIVRDGFAAAGVQVTQKVGGDSTATYALETDDNCDPSTSTGYSKFDIAMWDWAGYVDPDFMLSVVTKAQWCSWSDTGWDNPQYDQLYKQQGATPDATARQDLVNRMQQMVYDQFCYTQLVNEELLDAHTKLWTNIDSNLSAYSKVFYTGPHQTG